MAKKATEVPGQQIRIRQTILDIAETSIVEHIKRTNKLIKMNEYLNKSLERGLNLDLEK